MKVGNQSNLSIIIPSRLNNAPTKPQRILHITVIMVVVHWKHWRYSSVSVSREGGREEEKKVYKVFENCYLLRLFIQSNYFFTCLLSLVILFPFFRISQMHRIWFALSRLFVRNGRHIKSISNGFHSLTESWISKWAGFEGEVKTSVHALTGNLV